MFPIGDLPDSAAEIAAEQLVAVLSMEWLRICKEKVVPFATHSIKLLLVLDPVEHCGLRCQKLGIHRFNSSTSTVMCSPRRCPDSCLHLRLCPDFCLHRRRVEVRFCSFLLLAWVQGSDCCMILKHAQRKSKSILPASTHSTYLTA